MLTDFPFAFVKDLKACGIDNDQGNRANNHGRWQHANYAGVAQHMLQVRNEQASHREQQTLVKNLLKDSTRDLKAFAKLCARRFACEADAQAELSRFTTSLMLQLDAEVVSEPVYAGHGRPWRRANWPSVSNQWVGGN